MFTLVSVLPLKKPSDEECVAHGVAVDQYTPMLPVVSVRHVSHNRKIYEMCRYRAKVGEELLGCIMGDSESGFRIYYKNKWGLIHEWCHAYHGPNHVEN